MDKEKINIDRAVTISASVTIRHDMWIKEMKEIHSFNFSKMIRQFVDYLQTENEKTSKSPVEILKEKLGINIEE